MSEVIVTIVILIPTSAGGYERRDIPGVAINTQAPANLVLQGIINGLQQQYGIHLDINQIDMAIQGPDGSSLNNYIQNGSKIIIMPKYIAPPVRFPSK